MTEGARRQCRLAPTRKNTETNDALQLALFSSNDWSEESRQGRDAPAEYEARYYQQAAVA